MPPATVTDATPSTSVDGGRAPWISARRPVTTIVAASAVVALPLLAALVALRGDEWFPVLDLAMTEYRVRDVGSADTPLIGLPGRIGEYPDQGSHPGPLSFYLLAPTYRLAGSSSWALQAGTVAIHLAAIATALWIAHRRAGWRGVAVVGLLLAIVVRGFGQLVLSQPWNPYLPLLAWVVVLLATWAVLCGDHLMLVPLVVAATLCAQTHVPYLVLCVGLGALAIATVVVRSMRAPAREWRAPGRSLTVAAGIGAVLWLPPVVDQLRNEPGNIRQLVEHFGSPPEEAIGVVDGVRLALRHVDVWAGLGGQLVDTGRFVSPASAGRGAVVLGIWVVAAVVAWRAGPRSAHPAPPSLRALHLVIAAALALGALSMIRIFGRPWFYLTLWAWTVTTMLAGAVVWTLLDRVAARRQASAWRERVAVAAASGAAVVTLATTVAFATDPEHPEERLSDAVGTLAGPTYNAIVDGVGVSTGVDGRYLVRWSDAADIGSPGFGLLDELERRGLDVAADEFFHVPVTDHRVRPRAGNDAQIHLATGSYIERWEAVPDAVEVARFDPRTDGQRREYDDVRARLIERLRREGLGELVPSVDTNLFGLGLDERLSDPDQADLSILLELGQAMVVYVAPPPADGDAGAL